MSLIQSVLLAIVQGVAEFLPISSSGHLNLAQHLLGTTPSLSFDIFLNTATLLSVLFFFRSNINYFFKNLLFIIIASLPAAVVGVLFKNNIEAIFTDIKLLPLFFLITSLFIYLTRHTSSKDKKLNFKTALVIGLFQAIAILPGVSRSGSTIFAALLMGLSPINAFQFSFCLFIPASIGAVLLDLKNLSNFSVFISPVYLTSFVVTFFVSLAALKYLRQLLIKNQIWYFSIYTFALALILLFIFK